MPTPTRRPPAARPRLVALEDRATPAAAFVLSNNALIPIDTDFPTLPRAAVAVTGLAAGETLVGIDFRPQNGRLYGLATAGDVGYRLYHLDHRTGAATPLTPEPVQFFNAGSDFFIPLPVAGKRFGFDFDPTTDRIRVVSDAGDNFRLDPNTGRPVDADPAQFKDQPDGRLTGGATRADAAAFTNNAPNATVTTLYALDSASDKLFIQTPPSGGTLTAGQAVTLDGKPLDFDAANGFDIPPPVAVSTAGAAATGSGFAALTVGGKTGLYGVNLANGKAALIGTVGGGTAPVQGLAVSAAPGGTPLVGFDGANLLRFNSAAPDRAVTVPVTGVAANEVLVGIDFRPATGQLLGLGVDAATDKATLYRIDPQDGTAAPVGAVGAVAFVNEKQAAVDLPPASAGYGFDVDPTTDQVRVVTGTGLNFRVTATGSPVDADLGTAPGGATPPPVGVNPDPRLFTDGAFAGATGAAFAGPSDRAPGANLYLLDAATDKLFTYAAANPGAMVSPRPITLNGQPLDFTAVNGFDIPSPPRGVSKGTALAALTVGGSGGLYAIDLATGAATRLVSPGDPPPPPFPALVGLAAADAPPRAVDLIAVGSGKGLAAAVKVYNPDGQVRFTLTPYEAAFTGGVYVATADVTGDGIDDVVTGTGAGGGPRVRVFDGATGQPVREFFPYEETFRGGVIVAAGDVNGDGIADIITGTGVRGGPRVQVFDGKTQATLANYFAYEESFRGGVQVAAGDVNGDGKAEVITGTGVGGGPRVRVFEGLPPAAPPAGADPALPAVLADFFAYEGTFRGGVQVAAGDTTGDRRAEIITGTGPGGGPRVKAFDTRLAAAASDFFAFDQAFRGGVLVAAADRDGDGVADIVTGTGPGTGNRVLVYSPAGSVVADLRPFDAPFTGGVFVG